MKLSSRLADKTRNSLLKKVKMESQMLAYGTKADNLTLEEYTLLSDIAMFPKIPEVAENISYLHTYDGFLPDYTFRLSYEVPSAIDIDEIELKSGDFTKILKVQIQGERKLVMYEETQW
jgi:hypothetical protein